MGVAIRHARSSDAESVSTLAAQLGYDVPAASVRTRLASVLVRPDHLFLIAEGDGQAVGWIHAIIAEYIEADPFVVIAGLVVDRAHRGAGVGRRLVARIEEWAVSRGCALVRLWSSDRRIAAHRFYEGLGYRNIKTQFSFVKCVDPARQDAVHAFVPDVRE
jgi:GNAT superfamily N-acetyltransferase